MHTVIQSLISCRCTNDLPDTTHKIRDLGTFEGQTISYKFVCDFDYIYANDVAIISTGNDYDTAASVFVSIMSAAGPDYKLPKGY